MEGHKAKCPPGWVQLVTDVRTIQHWKQADVTVKWRLVSSVDTSKSNGYAFAGQFLNDQEYDLPVGGVLVQKNLKGSVTRGWSAGVCLVIDPDSMFRRVHEETYNWDKEIVSYRDLVAEILEDQNATETAAPV